MTPNEVKFRVITKRTVIVTANDGDIEEGAFEQTKGRKPPSP